MFAAGKTAGASSGSAVDAQFNYVTMLLHGDGTNGAQNNTFLDSSASPLTLTKTGVLSQGSFSPYGSNWSNYFDGSGDYLSVPDNAALEGFTNFTFECWVNVSNFSSGDCIFAKGWTPGGFTPYMFYFTSTDLVFYASSSLSNWDVAGGEVIVSNIVKNQWYHVAASRSGSSIKLFANGAVTTSFTSGSTLGTNAGALTIGASLSGDRDPTMYVSNLRINNTALYTAAFTPSTTPLTAVSGTALLTCADNRFIDDSTNNYDITPSGNTSVQRFNPFGTATAYSTATIGGSGYSADGTNNYLYAPASSNFQYTGDFSVEAWVYTQYGGPFWGTGGGGSNDQIYVFGPSTGIYYDGTTFAPYSEASRVQTFSWNHVCLTRQSGVLRMIVNGILNGTKSNSSTLGSNSVTPGIFTRQPTSGDGYIGYLCDLRVSNGSVPTSYQTSSTTAGAVIFTPPTAPVTTTSQGANSSNVKLLVNFTNGAIFDNAMMNDLETVGNAQISTSVVKYGTGSVYVNGSGNYAQSNSCYGGTGLGNSSFTIECWVNTTSTYQYDGIFHIDGGSSSQYSGILVSLSGVFASYTGSGWDLFQSPSLSGVNDGNWHHVALVRNGTSLTLYKDGTAGSAVTIGTNSIYAVNPGRAWVGQQSSAGSLVGYIDDFRITKGYARYTANFTPPTAAFQNTGPY